MTSSSDSEYVKLIIDCHTEKYQKKIEKSWHDLIIPIIRAVSFDLSVLLSV